MKPALLLVDIQQDYFPGGRMELIGAIEASRAAKGLLDFFRRKSLPVVHVQHISTRPGATFFLPNTEGINFRENVKPLPEETIVKKHFPNSFRAAALHEYLESRETKDLVICGMMSHMCVDATVRAGFDLGYACIVAHDACATRNLSFNGVDIPAQHVHGSIMAALSVFAKVWSVEEIISIMQV